MASVVTGSPSCLGGTSTFPRSPEQLAGPCFTGTMFDQKALIKNADMSGEMQQDSVECATQVLEKYNTEKDMAAHIKKEFDKKSNPTWHCIVGRNFSSYVTQETEHFIYFYLVRWPFFCSNLVKSTDCAKHPVIHPKQGLHPNSKYQRLTLQPC